MPTAPASSQSTRLFVIAAICSEDDGSAPHPIAPALIAR